MSTSAPSDENKARGILLAVTAFALFSVMDVTVKLLTARYSVPQVIASQNFFALLVILAYAAATGGIRHHLGTRRLPLHLLRAAGVVCGSFCTYFAYSRMPIADAYAIAFSAPLFITALSVPILREPVGWRRWSAVAVGFAGVLVMLRPGQGVLDLAALAALGGAFFYAGGMIIARHMKGTESSVSFACFGNLAGLVVYGAMLPWLGRVPDGVDLALSALGGTLSGTAMITLLTAFRCAPSAVVAPFQYTQIIWGILYGVLLFGTRPDGLLFVGGAIVIASGLYILYRETVLGRPLVAPSRSPDSLS
ncbi:DMT family transporter [Oleisolibacter albus]|uniref:DMT family transporter n=1 Tax=Oleisolibacter albus TaxID=2171757 RepID=UPI000DF33B9F|nr:DMT family transporter [Oleisolibacter albus]